MNTLPESLHVDGDPGGAQAAVPSPGAEYRHGAAHVEPLSDATQIYLHRIALNRLLEPEEELRFARATIAGDFGARQAMIEHNLRLVASIARQYLNRGMPFLDLIEEGNLGLMHALDKFDPERGFRFSTYATWWIRQYIELSIMNQSRTIRLPVHVIRELNTVLRARRHLEAHGKGEAGAEDIAHITGLTADEVREMLLHNQQTASLDAPLAADPMQSIGDSVADDLAPGPELQLHSQEVASLVRDWLAQLSGRQRMVIERRFGFNNQEVLTLEELAAQTGVTRERVRQIQLESLAELRGHLLRRGLSKEVLL